MKYILNVIFILILISCKQDIDTVNPLLIVKQKAQELSKKIDVQIKNNNGIYKSSKIGAPNFMITEYKGHILNKDNKFDGVIYQAHLEGSPEIQGMIEYKMVNDKLVSTLIMKSEDSKKFDAKFKQ